MLRRLLLVLAVLSVPSLVKAQETELAPIVVTAPPQSTLNVSDVFQKLPGLKQGVAYNINGKGVDYFTTVEIADFKNFCLSAGYSTTSNLVASLDYNLGGLKRFGINVPLLNIIELHLGFYVGVGNISSSNGDGRNKFAWGPELTLINVKF